MDNQSEFHPPVMRSNWPTIFGILGIIFGVFGFLNSAYQVFWMGMMQKMGAASFYPTTLPSSSSTLPPGTPAETVEAAEAAEAAAMKAMTDMMDGMAEIGKTKIYADGILTFLAFLLFVGGILLLLRYRISRPILLSWSYAKILVGIFGVILTQKIFNVMGGSMGTMMDEQMEELSGGSASAAPFDMVAIYEIMGTVFMVLGAIWIAALPIIMMIWLNRQDIKDDIAKGYGWK